MDFQPDYRHVVEAATNRKPKRMPLYEHIICNEVMETILDTRFADLNQGAMADRREYFRNYTEFWRLMGYDTVSYECCIGSVMPGSGALGGHQPGVIRNRADFDRYPWSDIPSLFFERYADNFRLLGEALAPGMKAVGGPGNGVFECVQDLVGFTELAYIRVDDPELYDLLFRSVGDVMVAVWEKFLRHYGDVYAVCRFGDDLGFKSATLISIEDIKHKVIPQYARVVELVHQREKPFLLHSCGNIFGVMDDLIHVAQIDAKHSNEDVIAPFATWLTEYGQQIGNFGGVDTDVLCQNTVQEIEEYVTNVYNQADLDQGVALGSGNSIPQYVPVEGYLAMVETVRRLRAER